MAGTCGPDVHARCATRAGARSHSWRRRAGSTCTARRRPRPPAARARGWPPRATRRCTPRCWPQASWRPSGACTCSARRATPSPTACAPSCWSCLKCAGGRDWAVRGGCRVCSAAPRPLGGAGVQVAGMLCVSYVASSVRCLRAASSCVPSMQRTVFTRPHAEAICMWQSMRQSRQKPHDIGITLEQSVVFPGALALTMAAAPPSAMRDQSHACL